MSAFIERLKSFELKIQANLDQVFCPVHLCLGQEEVPEALHECLRPHDWLFASHRSHGHFLAKGGSEQKLWDEIMGLESGINGGFSGSQEFSDPSINFHCSAIVGGLIGVATGTAYALKMAKSEAIVVCVFGDAAVEQGVAWESFNFAALHNLPIAYVCENNEWSIQSHIRERQATGISRRAVAFGLFSYTGAKQAIQGARDGYGPTFYEAHVTRECDHLNMATCPIGYKEGL